MAAVRKVERLMTSLNGIIEFTNRIPNSATIFTIETYIRNLEQIRDDIAEALDISTTIKESDAQVYWKTANDAFFEMMPKLLSAKQRLQPQQSTNEEDTLQTSVMQVLEGQRIFFEKFPDTLQQQTTSYRGIKVPALNIDCFSGGDNNYDKWPPFYNIFKASIHDNQSISTVHKFSLLRSHLKDEARDLINHLIVTDENYSIAWDKLCKRYHKPKKIALSYINRFINMESMSTNSSKSLRKITDLADEQLRGLDALGNDYGNRDPWLVAMLLSKVDNETRKLWSIESSEKNTFSFSELIEFLTKRCDALEDAQPLASKSDSSKQKNSTKSFHSELQYNRCPHCNENHPLFRCFKFLGNNIESRRNLVKQLNVCFNCLKKNHSSINCKSKATCQTCHSKHHTLLHLTDQNHTHSENQPSVSTHVATINTLNSDHNSLNNQQQHNSQSSICAQTTPVNSVSTIPPSSSSTFHTATVNNQTLLPTILAFARDSSGKLIQVRALLDSASMSSFITEQCCQNLGLQRTHACISIDALSCTTAGATRGRVELAIHPKSNLSTLITLDALVMSRITSRLPESFIDISNWANLTNITLADSKFNHPNKIDILIGVDLFYKLQCPTPIIHINKDVIAQETIFGWILAGSSSIKTSNSSSFITNINQQPDAHCFLQMFWKLEEVPECSKRTIDDIKAEKHFVEHLQQENDGKFTVRLPFKENSAPLGTSKTAALQRLFAIERKFTKNTKLQYDYREFMNQYLKLEHMEEVKDDGVTSDKSYYLPHHAVVKDDSLTTKVRVVFDASCKTSTGVSLNDCLITGPTIQRDLASTLLNFRSYNIAFISDVEKMYRMINVHPDDRNYQRILWRDNPMSQIKIFRLKTVTYGTSSAPFQAIRCLNEIGKRIETTHPVASEKILEDFYVDDLLSGSDTIENAIELKQQICETLQKYGMHLRKWTSNSNEFLKSIPKSNIESSEFELIDQQSAPTVKTLGLHWNPTKDVFTFKVNNANQLCTTKRQILSLASKVFDPLGWLAPITVTLKMFFQSLWLTNLDWDDEIPDQLQVSWNKLQGNLVGLENVTIPRCLHLNNSNDESQIQLHAFSDASESAYGAVVYVKVSNKSTCTIRLVTAKSKVAPIKQITLARLELCGALLLSKLVRWVLKIFIKYDIKIFAWCDSTIVLAWLDSHPRKWSNFVANRTSQILEIIPRKNWRHINSKQNPADLVSRGVDPDKLATNELWWNGPPWLIFSENNWPESANTNNINNVPETKNKCITLLTNLTPTLTTHNDMFENLFEHFSSFEKIKRVLCIFNRYIQFLQGNKTQERFIQSLELKEVELKLIRWSQNQSFNDEITLLRKDKPIPKSSSLSSLMPFLDKDNVLRVGGRIQNSVMPFQCKHPAILAKGHIVSRKIVETFHTKYLHTGPSTLLNILRGRFWITSCRSLVKDVTHKCLKCFRQNPKCCTQLMGNLPQHRVVPSRPFLHTGIDYAGPLQIRATTGRGRIQISKGYIAVFICYTTKAIHLELVSSLSSEAFIATLQRFVNRRGLPLVLYSDCGTNFVGAEKHLKQLLNEFKKYYNEKLIYDFAAAQEITFQFNPPGAPHFGGLWESNVKSVKTHLKRVTANTTLSFEELTTLLVQIEGLLNSRPIAPTSDNIDDINALTPGHFLIGDAILAIPEPSYINVRDSYLTRWQNIQKRVHGFWKLWSTDYLTTLQQRPKWREKQCNLETGNMVLIRDDNLPPANWALARVIDLYPGNDGLVRVAKLKTKSGELKRPIVKLAKLPNV